VSTTSTTGTETLSAPRLALFGGKGGVGKTTLASACAVQSATDGARVLVVSTDPAHSLGDALGRRLTGRPTAIPLRRRRPRGGSLDAVELDAARAFARWLRAHRQPLVDVIEHGTWLDRDDAEALVELSIPGVDELMGLLEILRWAKPSSGSGLRRYDLVIVDTAPTGHTLRLLTAPAAVEAVASVLDALQEDHRFVRERIVGRAEPEPADRLIAEVADQARRAGALLRDPARAVLRWVTLPEPMALAESVDAIGELTALGFIVPEVVVNRVVPAGRACPLCDRRRAAEGRVIAQTRGRLGRGRVVRVVPSALEEPRGVESLLHIGRLMAGAGRLRAVPELPRRRASLAPVPNGTRTPPESLPLLRDGRLIFFGGKGGVGKTTAAAATAVRIAKAAPDREILLLSTDPAHSLGDVFGVAIGDRFVRVPKAPSNLRVREIDAAAALRAKRGELQAALDEIGAALSLAGDRPEGRGGARPLVDLAPPGIDELLGMLSIAEHLSPDGNTTIIVDTAPTGHALRLLEMPEVAREWVQVLMRVLLKYRTILPPGQLASELVAVSRSIRALQTLLGDPTRTAFIIVTRAALLPELESGRLADRLRGLSLRVPAIVVNAMTLHPGSCPRCRATAAGERASLSRWVRHGRSSSRDCVIIQAPLTAPPPRGARALDLWARMWTS
jgi:arsenite-transporting ATPase